MKTNENIEINNFEENLNKEMDEFFKLNKFKDLEKETEYSNKITEIEAKIISLTGNEGVADLLNNYKYLLTLHILTILKEQENKMFKKGLKFGELLAQNKKK